MWLIPYTIYIMRMRYACAQYACVWNGAHVRLCACVRAMHNAFCDDYFCICGVQDVILHQIQLKHTSMIRYDEQVNMEWIADLMHVSVRTATKRMAPLKKHLGLRRSQSFTKSQVLQYLGLEV